MKQSELNHLRRLLGWVRCEIGQDPDAMVAMVQDIAANIGPLQDPEGAKRRLVEAHDKARSVPKYIREAVKALEKLTGPGDVVADAASRRPTPEQIEAAGAKALRGMYERGELPVLSAAILSQHEQSKEG